MDGVRKYIFWVRKCRSFLVIIPLVAMIIAYFAVRNLPNLYKAQAQIATGITDEGPQLPVSDAGADEDSHTDQKFANMTEVMKSKSMLNLVSYKIILHDLSSKPFKKKSSVLEKLDDADTKRAVKVFSEKYAKKESLNLRDAYQIRLYNILRSMEYDDLSLTSSLAVARLGATDFINVEYTSVSPELSAFIVNTLSNEFVGYHTNSVKADQLSSVKFLENVLSQKWDTLQSRISNLGSYKIRNGILNLNQQSSQIIDQEADYVRRIQQAEKDIITYRGEIANIDKQFNPQERLYYESSKAHLNQSILSTRSEIHSLYDKYVQSDFDEPYKKSIDSLQRILSSQINSQPNQALTSTVNANQDLVQQKLALQQQLGVTTYSLNSLKRGLGSLGRKFNTLLPHEAQLQGLEMDIDNLNKEYQSLLANYNQVKMESEYPVKIKQTLTAMPGLAEPSKKALYVLLSGVISLALCLIVIFILSLLDNRIRKPLELAIATRAPVLGYLHLIGNSSIDLKNIWKNLHGTSEMREFKKQLRSTRFEVSRELAVSGSRGSILNITSISEGEGKTLIAACIAYTYVMVSKKVLLIDGNFEHSSITQNSVTSLFIEDYFATGDIPGSDFTTGIMVMGNRGGDKSLYELADEKTIQVRLDHLKSIFDVIIVETPPLESLNKAKEWITYSDKTLSVFEANQALNAERRQHIHYLSSVNGKFIGWVLNKVKTESKPAEHVEIANVIE